MNARRSARVTPLKIVFAAVAVGVGAGLAISAGWRGSSPLVRASEPSCPPVTAVGAGVEVGAKVGQRAPDFSLPDFSGAAVSLSSFRGCPVILDFWASWCRPCQASVPKLEALRQRHAATGLKVIAVSLDYRREDAARFLDSFGIHGFINLWAPFNETRAIAHQYGIESIPRTVFLDRMGVIRFIGHPDTLTDDILSPWL
ncbi:MAG: hypothetical protein BIP78_0415 [Candidatus Bipolaricaulis sibiricus]|uniref:Thioredoxin domain-containing protein n=1 Tax=Bipolaricaulis sibiricus TaxID=2501609 RepID=A0A410FT83_BIPS1|nr:MAG: hypothetical protein BIP78_0415 [Candidatus Bipolaricaulis sibiricus]